MKTTKGFTLIEMMVVVLIMAGLAAIAYPTYTKVITKARVAEAFSLIEIVREAQQRNLAVNGSYFSKFTEAHISGRTRLIKSGGVGVDNGKLTRDNYTVIIADVNATGTSKPIVNGCIVVKYYKNRNSSQSEERPIFTITAHVEDSRIWCTELDRNNEICAAIPADTLEVTRPDCSVR